MPCFIVADPEFEPTYRKASHRFKLKDLRERLKACHGVRGVPHDLGYELLDIDPDYIGAVAVSRRSTLTRFQDPLGARSDGYRGRRTRGIRTGTGRTHAVRGR